MYSWWDTTDFWSDSAELKVIKSHRRRSNYYEEKRNKLNNCCITIRNQINVAENDGELNRRQGEAFGRDIIKNQFIGSENILLHKAKIRMDELEDVLKKIEALRNDAEQWYFWYRNKAEGRY